MPMIRFDILHRWTGAVQFTAEIDCADDAPTGIKVGLAVRWAIRARARLDGASLDGARLDGACLDGACLDGACLDGACLDGACLDGASLDRASLVDASLVDASLDRASLVDARLDGARLDRASGLIDGGQRSDGYRFVGWIDASGDLNIIAGCRSMPMPKARAHWATTRGGTPLGAETMVILDHVEAIARIRGMIAERAEAA